MLAALADAAVPDLLPSEVQALPTRPGTPYQRVRVTGEGSKRWTVQSALTEAAGSALDQTRALVRLLERRIDLALPQIDGISSGPDGMTVAVYPELPGTPMVFEDLTARSSTARALGTALAQLHDLEPGVYEEAGVPSYDADGYRSRRLAELDLGAETGHVPSGLLTRWERALEDVALWHFPTVPTHGSVDEGDIHIEGESVVALDGWHLAAVSDPALDFATLFLGAAPDAVDTVIESYAQARRERPDTQLERRIRLAAELRLMTDLREAASVGDEAMVRRCTKALHRLDEQTQDDDSLTPPPPGRRTAPVPETIDPEDIEPVDEDGSTDDEETLDLPVAGSEASEETESDPPDSDDGEVASGPDEEPEDSEVSPESNDDEKTDDDAR